MSFFLGGVGVLDVEVVDGPEMAVSDGLLLAGLLAEGFDLVVEGADLVLCLGALGGILLAFDSLAQVFDLVHQGGGVVVEGFGFVPVRFGLGFGVLLEGLEVDLPRMLRLGAGGEAVGLGAPPLGDGSELLHAQRLGLTVALHACWVEVLVEPDGVGGLAFGEEEEVGLDAGVGGEDAIGQADDGVELALLHEELLHLGLHAFAEEGAIRQDNSTASALDREELFDDEDKEHVRGLAGANVGGVVIAHAVVFHTAEGGIGDYAVDALGELPVVPAGGEGVAVLDHAGHVDAVEHHVGDAEEMGELFLLNAANALGDGLAVSRAGLLADLPFQMRDGGSEEAAGAAGWIEHSLSLLEAGVDHLHHELGNGSRGVKLPGISGAAQVIEDLLIHVAKLASALDVVKVDGFIQLLDDGQHLGAGLHVVVGILEDIAHDLGLRRGDCFGLFPWFSFLITPNCAGSGGVDVEFFEAREDDVVYVFNEIARGLTGFLLALLVFDVFGPISPAAVFRNG